MSPSPSSPCSSNKSEKQDVVTRSIILLGQLADWEDGRLISQNNHLVGALMPASLWIRNGGGEETKQKDLFLYVSPRMASLRQGDVLVSLPHHHFTGAMKSSVPCHVNEQGNHSCLCFWPHKVKVWATSASSRWGPPFSYKELKKVTVLHRRAVS